MISKRDIAKIAKRVLKRQSGLRDHQMIHPRREWIIGLLGGLILLIIGGTWSILTYRDVSGRGVDNAGKIEVEQTVYREEMVKDALEKFRKQNADYQELVDNRPIWRPPTEETEEEPVEETESEEVIEEGSNEEQQTETPDNSAPEGEPDLEIGIDIN